MSTLGHETEVQLETVNPIEISPAFILEEHKQAKFSKDPSALQRNAFILIDHADYENALRLLNQAIELEKDNVEALEWKGYCLKQLGRVDEALAAFSELVHIAPGEETYFLLAEVYYDLGDDSGAFAYYKKALSYIDYESPHLYQINKNLGNICVRSKDFDSAEEYYNRAYTLIPHSDDLFVNYGTLELQKGNYEAALERFKSSLDLNLLNDKAWVGLSLIYRTMGDFELSWGDLQRALDINFKNVTAMRIAIEWSLEEMNYIPAIRALAKYVEAFPNDIEWKYSYAGLLFSAGRWGEAREQALEILAKQPEHQATGELLTQLNRKLEN